MTQLPDPRNGTGISRMCPGCREQAAQFSAKPYCYCYAYQSCYHFIDVTKITSMTIFSLVLLLLQLLL